MGGCLKGLGGEGERLGGPVWRPVEFESAPVVLRTVRNERVQWMYVSLACRVQHRNKEPECGGLNGRNGEVVCFSNT